MKNIYMLLLACFIAFAGIAQPGDLQKEINEQVWKPFIKSFAELDSDKFISLHSKDVMRVTQDDKKIMLHDEYAAATRKWDESARKNKYKRDIELRFTNRIATKDKAFEVGYYKTTNYAPDGTRQSFFGKFHVTLRREDGRWKITLDTDTSKDVTEAQFNAASPLE